MGQIINAGPLEDQTITIKKGDLELTFPDRVPASLLPTMLAMQREDGSLDLSNANNLQRIFQIFARLIRRGNPHMTEDEVLDWLDIQDLAPILTALLSPPAPSSTDETEPTVEEATPPAATPKRKR